MTRAYSSGLEVVDYVIGPLQEMLDLHAGDPAGGAIGDAGERLTITTLSMNRPSLTRKLIASMAIHLTGFRGRFLVVDQGSSAAEISEVREACSILPFAWEVVELGTNYGVAGGRNRTIEHVDTEWVLWLDNDIYFIENPMAGIQRDLCRLGAHILNLPLLNPDGSVFSFGSHIYVEDLGEHLHIGGGGSLMPGAPPGDESPTFGSFVFGGASVMKVGTFKSLGGFDESMFVGFEDLDFSIRAHRAGLKVGCNSARSLVHDHPAPSSGEDLDYERARFSSPVLRASALRIEEKYGFTVWTEGVRQWLEGRSKVLGLSLGTEREFDATMPSPSDSPVRGSAPPLMGVALPRLALVVDVFGWAFSNIADQIVRHQSDRFHVDVHSLGAVNWQVGPILELTRGSDLLHFFWREDAARIGAPAFVAWAQGLGLDPEEYLRDRLAGRILTTSVYDHLFLTGSDVIGRRRIFAELVAAYTTSSERLRRIYESIPGYPPPTAVVQDGVDLELFAPRGLSRLRDADRPLVIGWSGNSGWSAGVEDFKGVNSILKPAVASLQSRGYPVELRLADRQVSFTPQRLMPHFYNSLDVYVCTSKIEGTPNPVLEAMACGLPVISTDVGIVPEVFGPSQSSFIIQRSQAALEEALIQLLENRSTLAALSEENLESIRPWAWATQARKFGDFFALVLEGRDPE